MRPGPSSSSLRLTALALVPMGESRSRQLFGRLASSGTVSRVDMSHHEKKQASAFEVQKQLFHSLSKEELAPYAGQYVVSVNGTIRDHDADLPTLTRRFFGREGNIPAYVGAVERPDTIIIESPI